MILKEAIKVVISLAWEGTLEEDDCLDDCLLQEMERQHEAIKMVKAALRVKRKAPICPKCKTAGKRTKR